MNVTNKPKKCVDCEMEIFVTSNRQLRCTACKKEVTKKQAKNYHKKTYIRKGYNQKGENNNAYKTGIGWYKGTRKKECEFCGSTLFLCVHHIDENRKNNKKCNLATLCRSCHVLVHSPMRDMYGKFISKV